MRWPFILTEIGFLIPAGGAAGFSVAVNGWSQSIGLTIHSFCEVDNKGDPSGGDAIPVPPLSLVGPTVQPQEQDRAGKCECITLQSTFNVGCNVPTTSHRFLAIELKPIPNGPSSPNNPSWWQPGPVGASYQIVSRTISVTVKGHTKNNPP